jgi:hypothetical protein
LPVAGFIVSILSDILYHNYKYNINANFVSAMPLSKLIIIIIII